MTTSEMEQNYSFWHWSNDNNVGSHDFLLDMDHKLYFKKMVQKRELEKIKDLLSSDSPQAAKKKLEDESTSRRRAFVTIIPYDRVKAAEYVPLTSPLVRLHYLDDKGKERTLKLKASQPRSIFDKLRAEIAPEKEVVEQQASKWTALRGPIFSIIFGGGWLLLAAFAATSKELVWQEKVFIIQRMIGWLIRTLGPLWLTVIAVIWIGASVWLLVNRLRKPLMMQVWKTS